MVVLVHGVEILLEEPFEAPYFLVTARMLKLLGLLFTPGRCTRYGTGIVALEAGWRYVVRNVKESHLTGKNAPRGE